MKKTVHSPNKHIHIRPYTVSDWWLLLLTSLLFFFTLLFLFSSYWTHSTLLKEEFAKTSVATADNISRQIEERIELEQSPLQYLSRDAELLHAVALSTHTQIENWLKKLRPPISNQLIYVHSLPSNKIYTQGTAQINILDMPRRTPISPGYSIYRTKNNQYLLNIVHPLRLNNQLIGTIGCIISMKYFIANLGIDTIPFSVLIRKQDTLYDVATGKMVKNAIPLAEIATPATLLTYFSEVRVITPLSVEGFLLLTQSQNISSHLYNDLLRWLLLTIPASILVFWVCRKLILQKITSTFAAVALTGEPFSDKKRIAKCCELILVKEFQESGQIMIDYVNANIKAEEQRRHTTLFNESDSAFAICDLQGNITEWNRQLALFLGDPEPLTLYGSPIKDIFMARDQLTVVTGMAHVRHNQKTNSNDVFKARLRLNSTRKRYQHVETTIKRMHFSSGDALVFMLHNITHQITTERGLASARQVAESSMMEHHKFYMGITDELHPLSEALRHSIIMLTETETTTAQERHLESLQMHSTLLAELITNIREFAQLETGEVFFERSHFEMEAILKQLSAATYSRTMQLGVDFSIYLDPLLPQQIWFDFSKSLQVLSNLVSLAAKKVQGGTVVLTAKAIEQRTNHVHASFEIYGLDAKNHITLSTQEKNSFPQIEYYGEKGQALSFAIAERMVKLYSLDLKEQSTESGAYRITINTDIPRLSSERSGLKTLLSGKKILLTYCPHNTIDCIGKALSSLGASCTYQPITENYCQIIIEAQQTFDLIINCGCTLETLPQEHLATYCEQLTKKLITVNHSYWEPTIEHPKIVLLRKPALINELLLAACSELMPELFKYEITGGAIIPDTVLFVGGESKRKKRFEEGLINNGYVVYTEEDITQGVKAIHDYRPEVVVIDADNTTLDSFWLTNEIRKMEAEEKIMPVRIIILSGPDNSTPTIELNTHTIISDYLTTNTELIHHILTLRKNTSAVHIA